MTIRYYVLPIEQTVANQRGPKYFHWKFDPDPPGIECSWSMKDYGSINQAVLCADISSTDHTSLSSHSDVLVVPINIDSALTVSARNIARNFLENYNIPAGWVNTGMTYRTVLRTITNFFMFFQRLNGILERDLDLPAGWLELEVQQIPAGIRQAMMQYADENGIDYSVVTPTTTMRNIMKYMADSWGDTPILFGIAIL